MRNIFHIFLIPSLKYQIEFMNCEKPGIALQSPHLVFYPISDNVNNTSTDRQLLQLAGRRDHLLHQSDWLLGHYVVGRRSRGP